MKIETFEQFAAAIDKLGAPIPRDKLQAIYNEVREQTAHELAEMQQKLDAAMARVHRSYLLEGELVKQ